MRQPLMFMIRFAAAASLLAALAACGDSTARQDPMGAEDFQREFVNVPLCGSPKDGPYAGKSLCTIHMSDGSAVVAGAGIVARGRWAADKGRICRRNAEQLPQEGNCVSYVRLAKDRYRNSDGVEFCIGPCT